ncbi:MAG: glutathione peroxidase [Bacteroidetes bacterium]|nr:MAG: glutathione peroxidase [Bacteroidota bacterium]RLD93155.1 MAG: glutathione peroxidase [Bacteroidota bacterium]
MNRIILLTGLLIFVMVTVNAQTTFYDFTVEDINGKDYPLSQLKGKKVLVVNTASKCGFTPQYEGLQELYEKYGDDDFVIIGFPANNFLRQEPGSNEEIAEFCSINYGVSFPMMSKVSVKGDDQHPLYKWLTSKSDNGLENSKVSWNFQKYMIDEEGQLVGHFSPRTKPGNEKLVSWIVN